MTIAGDYFLLNNLGVRIPEEFCLPSQNVFEQAIQEAISLLSLHHQKYFLMPSDAADSLVLVQAVQFQALECRMVIAHQHSPKAN